MPSLSYIDSWYVRTCHECQIHQTTCIQIPPTMPYPAALFVRVHIDTMDMPVPFKNFLHARCATTSYSEGHACKQQTAKVVGDWVSRFTLPVGRNLGDPIGQRHTFREGARLSGQAIPYQPHSHIGLQLASERNRRKTSFPRTRRAVQVLRG